MCYCVLYCNIAAFGHPARSRTSSPGQVRRFLDTPAVAALRSPGTPRVSHSFWNVFGFVGAAGFGGGAWLHVASHDFTYRYI